MALNLFFLLLPVAAAENWHRPWKSVLCSTQRPSFPAPLPGGPGSTEGSAPVQRSRWQWPRASCKSVCPSKIALLRQAFKPLKFRFSLWTQTLNKFIYCCSTDCKIGSFTVAKKERKEEKLREAQEMPVYGLQRAEGIRLGYLSCMCYSNESHSLTPSPAGS